MIDGEDFTRWSGVKPLEWETKIMIDCDRLMEKEDLRRFVGEDRGESKTGWDENTSIACTPFS